MFVLIISFFFQFALNPTHLPSLSKALVAGGSFRSRFVEIKEAGGYYERDSPRVPFNTPETLSSSSSAESSPDLPRRREKVMAALQNSNILHDDDDYDHLDFNRRDQLESFCRSRLNRVTGRTLYILLMEMRKADLSRDRVLDPDTIDQMVARFGIPLAPCMKQLHARFRDKRFVRSTNYENLLRFLEARREERQRLGPDEIQGLRDLNSQPQYRPQQSSRLALMVEDVTLVRSLQDQLARQIIDLDLLTNDMMEVAVGRDQISVEAAVRVLQGGFSTPIGRDLSRYWALIGSNKLYWP